MKQIGLFIKKGLISVFSDGPISIKRITGFIILLCLLRMTEHVMRKIIPSGNDVVFMHCYDMLVYFASFCFGAATLKDAMVQIKQFQSNDKN